MQYLQLIVYFTLTLSLFHHVSKAEEIISTTITVDLLGKGNFTSVQKAIDSIPSNNKLWTLIDIKAGIYREKVEIPPDKPYIVLQGESRRITIIQWGDFGDSGRSATFNLYADNFVAPLIQGDKAAFYHCGFLGLQDTLTDWQGRHFFDTCYIEGVIDFIWGGGQSIYQECIINATNSRLGAGRKAYITAQGRESEEDPNGFVFKYCAIRGSGPTFLGRAYRSHSRVVFYKSYFENIIVPKGWDAWNIKGKEDTITFSEVQNTGPGADMSKRVNWEKHLPEETLGKLVNTISFINAERWIENQPSYKAKPLQSPNFQFV
ncbi:hypothetical protein FH972_014360 [Carpinus fangiana]|uniref:pectinesterase n=1 Tax=Carpinus fangiana TaxID=176857 RepID=A0A5N6RBD1_9ROSI|nr:hypothetical protein FH972_014360 [Carpinus fangiana]